MKHSLFRKKTAAFLTDLFLVAAGNILYAFALACFVLPGNLITGGAAGIALFAGHITGLSVSEILLAFNLLMFFLGLAVLGKTFALTTLLSTFINPIALECIERLMKDTVLTDDPMLCAIFGGLCIGLSIGIVFRAGSSTGGMDIPPLVLYKWFHLPVSVTMYLFDFLILLLQAFSCTWEQILYGILLVLIYTVTLDRCMTLGTSKTELKVISSKSDEIRRAVLTDIDRGVTLLDGKTGYLKQETELLLTIISNRELTKTCRLIQKIDANAFLIISRVTEVRGRGFSEEKEYR